MIWGIDVGNQATKVSNLTHFQSRCTNLSNLLGGNTFQINSGTYFIGEGQYDTEYRKARKQNLKVLFLYALAKNTNDINNKVVVGLPISQYKQDREEVRNLLLANRLNAVALNGVQKKLYIEDVDVYPEGLINSDDGILVDIGGRTTEVARVENSRVESFFSIPAGTMNLYADFINLINSRYGLDLKPSDAERILKKGLLINDADTDVTFAQEAFRVFVDELVSQIQVKYPIKTLPVTILGGGGKLLYNPIKRRIPNSRLTENPYYANALMFRRVGEARWPNESR